MPLRFLIFAHRYNPDGTCDSICSQCFQTIANVKDVAELPAVEGKHICDPHILKRFEHGIIAMNERLNRSASG
jgi:hypothetical protein